MGQIGIDFFANFASLCSLQMEKILKLLSVLFRNCHNEVSADFVVTNTTDVCVCVFATSQAPPVGFPVPVQLRNSFCPNPMS